MSVSSNSMSAGVAVLPAPAEAKPMVPERAISKWAYPVSAGARDLRIDFIRGLVVLSLIINHIEIYSVFNLFIWERIGVVSGGEGFVILAGVVLGAVHRARIKDMGWQASAKHLIDRALQLYRINIFVIVSIGLLSFLRFIDVHGATTFTDRGAAITYPLYPAPGTGWPTIVAKITLLQYGPHQVQILGLYTVLLSLTPLILWAFSKDRVKLVLAISWILYFANWASPVMPTGAQFEYGFPVLSWQLIFCHGLAFGYFKKEIVAWFTPRRWIIALCASYLLFAGFMFFTLNNPYPALPPWSRLSFIPAKTFMRVYSLYFMKNSLGILRLLNYLVVLVVIYNILSVFWKPIQKALGWFFVPFGQASLYVFILHVYVLLLLYNLPWFKGVVPDYRSGNMWINTLGHAGALMILWLMVRFEVAFKWIPR